MAEALAPALPRAAGRGSVGLGQVRRLVHDHPLGLVGLVIVLTFAVVALFAPLLAPYDPFATEVRSRLQPPSPTHWLGTDQIGRDILSRVIYGARVSVLVGILSVLAAAVVGTAVGLMAGYYGRGVELLTMRGIDILLAYPTVLLAILIVAFFGTSLVNVVAAIAITRIPSFARVAHGLTLSIKEKEFVEAARALGTSDLGIGVRHILPNLLAPVIVQATLQVAVSIIIEATLGYLGLSVPPPTPTWGSIIQDGRGVLDRAPWIANSAGAMIFLLVIAINMLGDGLRDYLDPRAVSGRRRGLS
jgi:ABC-type dipeptide/oligopeptide/nickel transport system permease subunit